MKDIRIVAKEYIAAGFSVFWVPGIGWDEAEECWYCLCGMPHLHQEKEGKVSGSPGKHPPKGSTGFNEATLDPTVVDSWPFECETGNLAIRMTETFVAVDFDLPLASEAILKRLNDPNDDLSQSLTVDISGRLTVGLHAWIRSNTPMKSSLMRLKGTTTADPNHVLGEIRAANSYVILPPSRHISGKLYAWFGERSLLTTGPTEVADGADYIRELLASVGIELSEVKERADAPPPPPPGEIQPTLELPFETENQMVIAAMEPNFPRKDRSGALVHLAGLLVREAKAQNLPLDVELLKKLAGVLWGVDRRRAETLGEKAKYDNRPDMYWKTVFDIAEEERLNDETAQETSAVEEEKKSGNPPYRMWGGNFIHDPKRLGRPTDFKVICNFEPRIVDKRDVWTGEADSEPAAEWLVRLSKGDEVVEIWVEPNEYKSPRFLLEALRKKGMPSHFQLDPTSKDRFFEAGLGVYSGLVPTRKAVSASGWGPPGEDFFALPGARGVITADGIDESRRYESPATGTPSRFFRYGAGVEPHEGVDLIEVLRALYHLREASISVPIVTQTLGAALASLGVRKSPLILHTIGHTGSFKSSMHRANTSVFGHFTDESTDQVEDWASTANALQAAMYRCRDLPMVVIDYKASKVRIREVVNLLQSYGDSTGRGRLSRDQREVEHHVPRCLLLSDGEDAWDNQESVSARSLFEDVSLPQGADSVAQINAIRERLSELQRMADDGRLQTLGYEWLRWLCARGQVGLRETIASRFEEQRQLVRERADQSGSRLHTRSSSSFAMLQVVSSIIREFVEEMAPGFLQDFLDLETYGWSATHTAVKEQAEEALQLSPYNLLMGTLRQHVRVYDVSFQPTDAELFPEPGKSFVGRKDDNWAYLSEALTFGWYKKLLSGQREEPVFSWKAFVKEAVREHGAVKPTQAMMLPGQGGFMRFLKIPISELTGEAQTAAQTESDEVFE